MKHSFSLRQPNPFLACAPLLLVLFWNSALHAAVYYVDFNGGNDANAGTSTATAWKTLPGSRNANGVGWKSTSWGGVVDQSHKVAPGTVFYLKSGSLYDGTVGGRVQIDSTYYQNGTAASPITIQRLSSWGSGSVIFDGASMTIAAYRAILEIVGITHVTLDGTSPSGIVITNSAASGLLCIASGGTNGAVLRNLEVGNTVNAGVKIYSTAQSPLTNIVDITLDGIIAHHGTGTTDTDSRIWIEFVDGFVITNCTAYASASGADGIHTGSARNGWILNCTTYGNGEQGIDLSRDGGYKTRDDSFNITVRDCISHNNSVNDFDHNSGTHGVIWLNCFAWGTTSGQLGDACFNVHEGTAGPNWWINCSSSRSSDRGYNFGWGNNPWRIPAGVYKQRLINCVSSRDSTNGPADSRGGSVWIEGDTANGCTSSWQIVNCILNTTSTNYGTVNYKDRAIIFTARDVATRANGWFGVGCLTNSPDWKSTNETWALANETPNTGSPCLNGGAWVFTTSASGATATTLTVESSFEVDAARVFRAGDWINIEGAGTVQVVSVTSPGTMEIDRATSWAESKGVWFVYSGTAPQIGAFLRSSSSPRNLYFSGAP